MRRAVLAILMSLVASALVIPVSAAPAQALLLEHFFAATYNMQGGSNSFEDKWNRDVKSLATSHDVVALQEAGVRPPITAVLNRRFSTPEGTVSHYTWNMGTSTRPQFRYIYWLDTDPGGRVNLALVLRNLADDWETIPAVFPSATRGALGVELGQMWFYTLHASAGNQGGDGRLLLERIDADNPGGSWAALGDYNRAPNNLQIPTNAITYNPGAQTHQSGGELDYMVTNDRVDCYTGTRLTEIRARVLPNFGSDHSPVDFPLSPCITQEDSTPPLRIMAFGDSITGGAGTADGNSYRAYLRDDLGAAGYDVDYVGGVRSGTMVDNDTEAHSGLRIENATAYMSNVARFKPNVITLHLGSTDMQQDFAVATAPDRLISVLEQIEYQAPDATVFLASLVPSSDERVNARIHAFNATLPDLVSRLQTQGKLVAFVDMHAVNAAEDLTDYYQPNSTGYAKMADAFEHTIDSAAKRGWIRPPVGALVPRAETKSLRVMPLGSSTTYGIHNNDVGADGNGYRKTLDEGLQQLVEAKDAGGAPGTGAPDATPRVDLVGSVRVGTMADRDNEGWPGYKIDDIAGKARCSVPVYRPNLVTMTAGGNDVIYDFEMGTALSRLERLVTQVQDDSPAATVLVSSVQRFSDPARDARGLAFSQGIPGMVDRLAAQGRRVLFVDLGLTSGDTGADGIHPTTAGYAKIGRAFTQATSSAFDRGWIWSADAEAESAAASPCGITDGGSNNGTSAPAATFDTRWLDQGVSFKDGFGHGKNYRWGDVNADGKPELFVVEPDQSWTFYWNNGRTDTGWTGWAKGITRAAPGGGAVGNALRFADIDGDNRTDCVRVNLGGTITVSTWDDTKPVGQKLCGTPFKAQRLSAGAVTADTLFVFADVDGDNRDDYMLVQPRGTTRLWLNRSPGWIKGGQITGPIGDPRIRRWADIDRNGRADQILITAGGGARAWLNEGTTQNADGTVNVALRDIGAILKDTGLPPGDMHFIDAGGDGNADLVRTGWTGVSHIWLNRLGLTPAATADGPVRDFSQDPRWEDHGVSFKDGFGTGNTYQWGDVNSDGKPELFVIKPDLSYTFYWNGGRTDVDWTEWATGLSRPAPGPAASGSKLKIADMDGDGRADCAYVNGGEISFSTWNDAAPVGAKLCGNPYKTQKVSADCCAYDVVLADVTGDKRADYLQMGVSGDTRMWSNEPSGWESFGLVVPAQPDGHNKRWRWADLDGNGYADRIAVSSRGTAHAWLTSGLFRLATKGIITKDIGEIANDIKDVPPDDVHFVDVGGNRKADYLRTGWTGVTHIWLNQLTSSDLS